MLIIPLGYNHYLLSWEGACPPGNLRSIRSLDCPHIQAEGCLRLDRQELQQAHGSGSFEMDPKPHRALHGSVAERQACITSFSTCGEATMFIRIYLYAPQTILPPTIYHDTHEISTFFPFPSTILLEVIQGF